MQIVLMDETLQHYFNTTHDPFEVFGKLDVKYHQGKWLYEDYLFEIPYLKHYNFDGVEATSFLKSDSQVVFLALDQNICVGQIVIKKNWNMYCFIEDITIKNDHRKKKVGTALLNQAELWAKEKQLKGFMLETQNINLGACRFYIKNGFVLGGVDTMLYQNFDTSEEQALFFYKRF